MRDKGSSGGGGSSGSSSSKTGSSKAANPNPECEHDIDHKRRLSLIVVVACLFGIGYVTKMVRLYMTCAGSAS